MLETTSFTIKMRALFDVRSPHRVNDDGMDRDACRRANVFFVKLFEKVGRAVPLRQSRDHRLNRRWKSNARLGGRSAAKAGSESQPHRPNRILDLPLACPRGRGQARGDY